MLSIFIRRNGRRKDNKVNGSRFHQKSYSVSSSPASSSAFNISKVFPSQLATQSSQLVELNLSDSNEEWFPEELLRSRNCSSEPSESPRRSQNAVVARNNLTQETHAGSSSALSPSRSENVSSAVVFRRKSIPAPIFIPGADFSMPSTHVGNSVVPSPRPPIETSQPNTGHVSLDPPSPSTSDNLSVISGTTLPHALIGASFVLSSTECRNSRRQSGVVRQDSATLPRGEASFRSDSQKPSSIPPVPPVFTVSAPAKPIYPSPVKSGARTEPEYPMSDSYTTPPEIAISSAIPPRTSSTQGTPSSVASTSTETSPSVIPAATSQRKASPMLARTRIGESGVSDGAKTTVEVPFPASSQGITQHSPQDGSDGHSLGEFDFVSSEPFAACTSPNSDSSTPNIAPLPKRSGIFRGQRKHRVGGSNPVRYRSKDNSLAGATPTRHQGYGMPSATSEHDYDEPLNCDLTVSPQSSASARYQTFPETPMVFSPLWSPELARSDGQVLHKRPPSPESAGLRSAKMHSSARRQLDNKDGAGGPGVPHRSKSSWLPAQQTPSPIQAELKLSTSLQVINEAGIPDETSQRLTMNTTESQDSAEVQSTLRPHPLVHISSSSSSMPEEEALQAIARDSASFLPSLTIDNVDASVSSVAMPASAIKSPTFVPLSESTDRYPFNSPALADSPTMALPSASPLRSPTSMATVTVSPSNSPFSVPPSSLGGSSFLPSPSPPASLKEPFSQLVFLTPSVSPPAVSLDDSLPPSPHSAPPPPYHTIVPERVRDHPSSVSTPSLSRTSFTERCYQRLRQASNFPAASGSVRSRVRARPPLPIGPRKPNGPRQILGALVPSAGSRNGSTSSVASSVPTSNPESLWRKLQSAVSKPPPRFQSPPPKWRGLTLEAAQWTFTSAQLQEMVSRAIQQASEGSSLRLLRLEILDGEIADETHHLELQHMDVKAQYKGLVRRRWTLMGVLAGHIEGVEMNDVMTVSRTMEELTEVLLALDRLADQMHDIVLRMAQLKSLHDVHNASALAMAVRKINGIFVRQMAEKERLQEQVDTLQTERDEAWKHAQDIAQDYDTLTDRVSETAFTSTDARVHGETQSLAGSRRSMRISAVRKSSIRLSQAGLRSRGKRRRTRSSSNATRPTSLASEGIPPVPRLLVKPLSLRSTTFSALSGNSVDSLYTSCSPTSASLALAEAQREVYEMLGLSLSPSQASSRRWTLSNSDQDLKPPSLNSRRMSESFIDSRTRHLQWRGRGRGCGRGASSSSWIM